MRILFLPRYTSAGSSSRYRIFQYMDLFTKAGIQWKVVPLFDDQYVRDQHSGKPKNYFRIIASYFNRVKLMINAGEFDMVYIEKELFPYLPYWFEQLLLSRVKVYLLDYDDAIFENYRLSKRSMIRKLFGKKIGHLVRGAKAIVTATPYLTAFAKDHNKKVYEIPVAVDWNSYASLNNHAGLLSVKENEPADQEPFVIGWIGSPATAHYLLRIKKTLQQFLEDFPDARLKLIGFNTRSKLGFLNEPDEPHEQVEIIGRVNEQEIDQISSFDVGIMPLDPNPFTRGRCGVDLIQYMACGKPTISTPLEMNVRINEGSDNLFASTGREWYDALKKIYMNRNVYKKVGEVNRQIVTERYTVQSNLDAYLGMFEKVLKGNRY